MEEKIIEIIENVTGFKNLRDNKQIDLLENEMIDSYAFIELITRLEEEFDIEIQPTQISPDIWRSLEKITEMITKLKMN